LATPATRATSDIVSVRTLSEYVDDFLALGKDAFLTRHSDPVLLCVSVGESEAVAEFNTVAIGPDALESLRTAATDGPVSVPPGRETQPGDVLPIVKRAGSAFENQIGIGRARNADVWLPAAGVSKYHAYFSRTEEGTLTVTDADSTNGIVVGLDRIPPRTPVPVRDGTKLTIGPFRLVLYLPQSFSDLVARRARLEAFDLE
jgi:hypothetical protein